MEEAGRKLKRARDRLKLRFRDVEEASAQIAARRRNDEFIVALSRLADVKQRDMPSIYRLYSCVLPSIAGPRQESFVVWDRTECIAG
jgi:hypothetical protein